MNIASRTLAKSGAYLLGQAKKLARGLWKRSLRFSTARQAIDGYIVEGKRCGNVGSATVYDPALVHGQQPVSLLGPAETSGAVREYLHGRASTIYGGSNEIQRNIISKAELGL